MKLFLTLTLMVFVFGAYAQDCKYSVNEVDEFRYVRQTLSFSSHAL